MTSELVQELLRNLRRAIADRSLGSPRHLALSATAFVVDEQTLARLNDMIRYVSQKELEAKADGRKANLAFTWSDIADEIEAAVRLH